jgi:hypothetical protein
MRFCVRLVASSFAAAAFALVVAPAAGAVTAGSGAGAVAVSAVPDRPCLRLLHRDRCHHKRHDGMGDKHEDKGEHMGGKPGGEH